MNILLAEILQLENKENVCLMRPKHPRTLDLSSRQLGWTIMKLYMYHVPIHFQAHLVKALQLISIHQCCMQAKS